MKFKLLSIMSISLAFSLNAQPVDISSLRINDSIPKFILLAELIHSSSPIDSITAVPETMDMSMADSLIYIGETYFEFYSYSGICELQVMVFDNKLKNVKLGGYQLTGETTIEEIRSYFPKDCSTTVPVDIYEEPEKYQTCAVPVNTPNGQLIDMSLIFFFLNGNLARIDVWEPS